MFKLGGDFAKRRNRPRSHRNFDMCILNMCYPYHVLCILGRRRLSKWHHDHKPTAVALFVLVDERLVCLGRWCVAQAAEAPVRVVMLEVQDNRLLSSNGVEEQVPCVCGCSKAK